LSVFKRSISVETSTWSLNESHDLSNRRSVDVMAPANQKQSQTKSVLPPTQHHTNLPKDQPHLCPSSISPNLSVPLPTAVMPPRRPARATAPQPGSTSGSNGPSTAAKSSEASKIAAHVWDNYVRRTPQRVKLLDAFMAFLVVVGALQFVYCVIGGNYVRPLFAPRSLGRWGEGTGSDAPCPTRQRNLFWRPACMDES
jgi:hypothetical protein